MSLSWDRQSEQEGLIKFPRTPHLPWSKTVAADDRMARSLCLANLGSCELVYTEKMDGENTTMTRDVIHARSLDGYGKGWQSQMMALWGGIHQNIPKGLRICGENMFAVHSITYEELTSYFYAYTVFDGWNCLSWDDTVRICTDLGLPMVPVIRRGIGLEELPIPAKSAFGSTCEGYVVRPTGSFESDDWAYYVAKVVRANHVTTDQHWSRTWKRAKLKRASE